MKVLLTGASGFVGSHVLDRLRARGVPTAVLLRPTSKTRLFEAHLASVEVRSGSINVPESLPGALDGITHIIHCAGLTKARSADEFMAGNQAGTKNLVVASNARPGQVQRFVHISSLAAIGPSSTGRPAREADVPNPISDYGKSKLAGELEVRNHCQAEFVILRPPAVYGPRDYAFLSLFKAISRHILPLPSPRQALSLVFVEDLADAMVACLERPAAAGKAFFVANSAIVTARDIAREIAAQIGHWTVPLPLPPWLLWPVCLFQELCSRLTRKASLLNLQKFAELRAPAWTCDTSLLEKEVGCTCSTGLKTGVEKSLKWYRMNHWL